MRQSIPPGIREPSRFIVVSFLLAIYLVITMSPLAPLAMKSPRVAHAVTGECAGDCDICGCSPERRASHTCCCWLKRMKHPHGQEQENVPACCRKKHPERTVTLTCNCPCGSPTQFGLWNGEKLDQVPYRFTARVACLQEDPLYPRVCRQLTDRHDTPPKPPPRLSLPA